MAEPTQYSFSYKEIVEMLIQRAGVTEGVWTLNARFGLHATNLGPTDDALTPSAIVGLVELGIQRVEKLTNLSVDAAKIATKTARES